LSRYARVVSRAGLHGPNFEKRLGANSGSKCRALQTNDHFFSVKQLAILRLLMRFPNHCKSDEFCFSWCICFYHVEFFRAL